MLTISRLSFGVILTNRSRDASRRVYKSSSESHNLPVPLFKSTATYTVKAKASNTFNPTNTR